FGRETLAESSLGWRAVDLCERAAALLIVTAASPALLAAGAVTALLSRRPPLIAHLRAGHNGSPLWMLKLRTMWDSGAPSARWWIEYIDDDAGPGRKQPDDSRVTSRFAAFCRKHSIDELPQLWHVVKGEMALIGPRPLTRREIRTYYAGDAEELLSVKPGIAGLWQTSGRNRLTYAERRRLDLAFVRDRSVRMYLRILVRV